ncbi:CGNR zinc finger domain-containing protein [Nonomuraea sp. NPDC049480]|uniref:CGNR zinc finger domain-containing protein n=1 Tax=Nonomuraea sp. NPDC049480 TaxID=3364353 RepID=UPI00378DF8F2
MELLIGEPLALDLVNTRARDFDALDAPGDFQEWLARQAGRLTVPAAPLKASGLAAVRRLRGHVESAINAVREAVPPPEAAVAAINEAARAAPPYRVLEWRDGAFRTAAQRDGGDLARLLAQLAEAAADLLTDPAAGRIRGCEGPQCRMLFLPAHPRRRWCSPDLCGNRVRVARYYQRHKPA